MGLLDGVLGSVVGNALGGMANNVGSAQGGSPLLQIAMQLIQQHGGLGGMVDQFRQQGLAREVESWVGTGANLPVSVDQIKQALGGGGGGGLAALAGKLGMSEDEASHGLAQALPEVVNHLTPEGRVPDEDSLQGLMSGLGGKLFGG